MIDVGNLSVLSIPSLIFMRGTGLLLIASLIANNHTTLRHLDLGVEKSVRDCQMRAEPYSDFNAANRIRKIIVAAFQGDRSVYLPNIDTLRLRGLDIIAMMSGEQHRFLNFASLKHLALESCFSMNSSLQILTALSLGRLQSFRIRLEGYEDNFLKLLENFLCTLPPLTALSILLNGSSPDALDLAKIMKVHAISLRVCIVDLRDYDRIATVDSRSGWRRQYSLDIIELCPNLVELGISVDWHTLNLGSRDGQLVRELVIYFLMSVLLLTLLQFLGQLKACLPKLHILNIRDMPKMDGLIIDILTSSQIKGIALSWLDEMIAAGLPGRSHGANGIGNGLPPPIKVLAFGCLRYADVWSDSSYAEVFPPAYFTMLRTFAVDYFKTSLGHFAPVLTQVTWGPECGLPFDVLRPYWLL